MGQVLTDRKTSGFHPAVKWWLLAGLLMVVGQIVIGGITRLTESGLSITEWKPLSGAMPPLNAADWQVEFEKYRDSPQFEKIFADISMADFKFIYFWEWFHRQWARIMGLVFVVGFAVFSYRGWLGRALTRRLGVVVALAALAASFGWIMVASGLHERPWVNAYKLAIHLSLGITLFSYLLWITLKVHYPGGPGFPPITVNKWRWGFNVVLGIQLILGGIMSGARAALPYPTWPDMNGEFFPTVLTQSEQWTVENLVQYEASLFQPALTQFLHRMTAYTLFFLGLYLVYRVIRSAPAGVFHRAAYLLISLLIIQVMLGVATVVSSKGEVPVGLGVAHQFGAIALVAATVWFNYLFNRGIPLSPVGNLVDKGV